MVRDSSRPWHVAARGVKEDGAHFLTGAGMAALLSNYVLPVALGAVALALLLGLFNMVRGGSSATSQTLMRWRVALQLIAIIVVMLAVWALGR